MTVWPPNRSTLAYFDVALSWTGRDARLVVRGELDLGKIEPCGVAVEDALRGGATRLVIELRDVTFCDSSGLRSLLRASTRCEEAGVDIRLASPSRIVRRVINLTGLSSLLDVDDF